MAHLYIFGGLPAVGKSELSMHLAWRQAAIDADAGFTEIEVICSDQNEHRHRVESRASQIPGLMLPDWQAVLDREYHEWNDARIVIDTARQTPAESKLALERALHL